MKKQQRARMGWLTLAALLAALAVVGCIAWLRSGGRPADALQSLTSADRYELQSLSPRMPHQVLGSVVIIDAATRDRLNAALQAGVREGRSPAACFNPRHGIRVTRSGETTDFIICFECRQVQVWRGGKQIASFLTNGSPQTVFDDVLTKAGVQLAP